MRFSLTIGFLGFLSSFVALIGCGPSLDLNLVQADHQTPSNVAVFFTVDTNGGEPVAGLTAEDFRIYEDGALVSVDESKQTIINPEVAAKHYTLLLVDMSGSVTESDQVPLIEQAASQFTSTLEGYQEVAVYAFDGSEDIHPITPFTSSSGRSSAGVNRLSGFRTQDPSTNLHGAIVQATEVLNAEVAESETPLTFGTIVVFTDGTDRAARVSFSDMMSSLDDVDYDVFAVGVGNEIDEPTLAEIGFSGYVLVENAAAVNAAFEAIGEKIVGFTQRFYLLSYCSPARAGVHEVTEDAVKGEAMGDLDYTFDAEGFGPDCNPDSPPPFDTTGTARRPRRRPRPSSGARIQVSASAGSGGGGASASAVADPEAGDY
ncbi:MAG: VWA domain-containing protein [Deltaproteobacteria bacterium]|nr:MAG: VWA domain-containing protein [Deltaproteobacteria bacterium]